VLVNGYCYLQDVFGPGQLVLAPTTARHSLGGATTQAWMQVLAWMPREHNCPDMVRQHQLASGPQKRPL